MYTYSCMRISLPDCNGQSTGTPAAPPHEIEHWESGMDYYLFGSAEEFLCPAAQTLPELHPSPETPARVESPLRPHISPITPKEGNSLEHISSLFSIFYTSNILTRFFRS